MSLADWAHNGWLVEHRTSPKEIEALLSYEHAGLVSETEVHEMLVLARTLRQKVADWLRQNYANLLSD